MQNAFDINLEYAFELFKVSTYPKIRQNYYEISNQGTIVNIQNRNEISRYIDGRGYLSYTLVASNSFSSKCRPCKAHILVAHEFIGPRPNGMVINHIDGNKLNPTDYNLEYCTQSENRIHGIVTGLSKVTGEDNCNNKFPEELIHTICKMMEDGMTNSDIAKTFGINSKTDRSLYDLILKLRQRKNWHKVNSLYKY